MAANVAVGYLYIGEIDVKHVKFNHNKLKLLHSSLPIHEILHTRPRTF